MNFSLWFVKKIKENNIVLHLLMKEGMFMESRLIYQTDKQLVLKFEEENIELPKEIQDQIKGYWQEKLIIQPALVNGPIYSIHKIKKTNPDELTINIRKTDYAHYLYAKEQGMDPKHACRSIAANCLMITKDNYLVLGVMNQHTSMPSTVKFIGGAFSEIDIKNSVFEVASCIEREVFEELGIRLSQIQIQEQVQTFILTRANFSFMNTLQIKSIKLSKAEVMQAFRQFQTSEMIEQELSDIMFTKNDPEAISLFVQENEGILIDYMQEFFLVYNQMIQPREMIERLVD